MGDGENSVLRRLAVLPAKLKKHGLRWSFRRAGEIAHGVMFRCAGRLTRLFINLLSQNLPYVRSFSAGTMVVYYDLAVYPISYDICWFLVWADFQRQRQNLRHLHCIFLPIEDHQTRIFPPGYDAVVDRTSREWRFQNICVAMMPLIRASAGFTVCNSRAQAKGLSLLVNHRWMDPNSAGQYPPLSVIYRNLVASVAQNDPDWGLRAPEQGLRYIRTWFDARANGRKVVVVTLRQYAVDKERNSRTADWLTFLRALDQTEYFPVLVRDTDCALVLDESFEGVALCNEAAWSIGLRAALYEVAFMNMFVNCGPASLCILNPRTRYMLFKIIVPGIHLASEATLRDMGFEPGTQPPFAGPFQRWIWEDDRLDVITREFNAMVERIAQSGCGSASTSALAS
ncbi:MAG TPA: hypothetical protein VGR79_05395 [Stellaceae bacterium]|nr:hypothetical protein [Stellaceae bacterium]